MKQIFAPARILTLVPPGQSTNSVLINLLLQIGKILTAYEVNLNHQYLFIFSVDFHVFGHCSISIPHRSQKDPLYALAYFLVYFSWFSAVCPRNMQVYKKVQIYIYLYNGFPNPSLYQRTILTRSVGDDGVILHGKLVNIPETDCIRVTGTAKEEKKIKDEESAASQHHTRTISSISGHNKRFEKFSSNYHLF